MRIEFPYPDTALEIPAANLMGIYSLPQPHPVEDEETILRRALGEPHRRAAAARDGSRQRHRPSSFATMSPGPPRPTKSSPPCWKSCTRPACPLSASSS